MFINDDNYGKGMMRPCAGTWMYCDGKCSDCINTKTITTNRTINLTTANTIQYNYSCISNITFINN